MSDTTCEPGSPPLLSILVINWNSRDDLIRCLDSLRFNGTDDREILVIDNASEDDSVAATRQRFPDVRIQANDANLGHTGGFNQGITLLTGRYVLLLDADTIVPPGAVDKLLGFMIERPDVALLAPRLVNLDGSLQETSKRFPGAMTALFGRHSTLTRWFPNNPFSRRYLMRDKHGETDPYPVQATSAAAMLFRRELVEKVGAWDTDYPGYWVDIDWCMTLHEAGRKIYYHPGVRVVHDESYQPERKKGAHRIWIFHKGAYRLFAKHYTRSVLDPRRPLVRAALALRAGIIILADSLRSENPPVETPARPGATADKNASG